MIHFAPAARFYVQTIQGMGLGVFARTGIDIGTCKDLFGNLRRLTSDGAWVREILKSGVRGRNRSDAGRSNCILHPL